MLAVDGSGTIQESYRYTEFGETTVVDSDFNHTTRALSEIHNSKRYTARDRIIGDAFGDSWYHYRARTYRAHAGRFVERHSLWHGNESNLYYRDPSTLFGAMRRGGESPDEHRPYVIPEGGRGLQSQLAEGPVPSFEDKGDEEPCDPPDGSQVDSWAEHCKCQQGSDYQDAVDSALLCASAACGGATTGIYVVGAFGGPIGLAVGAVVGAIVGAGCLAVCNDALWKSLKNADRWYKFCLKHPEW
jgi:hypothetical protein